MKILVIQLARLGDLYQTWPVLRALKAQGNEIDVLCRSRFSAALEGIDAVDNVIELNSKEILRGVLTRSNVGESLFVLDDFLTTLNKRKYDKVINLSFSPLSSYITYELANGSPSLKVRGYSRFEDDFLKLEDDPSAYFFAQCGPGKANVIGLTDIFAQVAEVQVLEDHWRTDFEKDESKTRKRVVCHLGASQAKKMFQPEVYAEVFRVISGDIDVEVVLIGAPSEAHLAERFLDSYQGDNVTNLVGKTKVSELFGVIGNADVVIGGDSAPMHIASLVNTPALNLSCREVSFYETGPRSWGSRILFFDSPPSATYERIAVELRSLLSGSAACYSTFVLAGEGRTFVDLNERGFKFESRLIEAIYLNKTFPSDISEEDHEIIAQLKNANTLALASLNKIGDTKFDGQTSLILQRVDGLFQYVEENFPRWAPLMSWVSCEKLRIGPFGLQEIITSNIRVHQLLDDILSFYIDIVKSSNQEGVRSGDRVTNAKRD